ncbi:hypothetical protein DPMN_192342 [Dreissena polymorpha]|uniref:Uncharacterized protein n=1 Tax=Dreissena polymorpha TaxID=45954 RepID=A0A9D3Y4L8_DREPO|nr:hypothetical protein DPMN_192342 [Dreissena polymorpha]
MTGNDRLGTGNNRDFTGNNRDGTVRDPVYLCNVAIKGLCRHSAGLYRGVAVALSDCVWAPVELRCRPGCSRYSPGCSRYHTGRSRSYPVTPASSRRCLITHWGSAGIILRLGLNRFVTRVQTVTLNIHHIYYPQQCKSMKGVRLKRESFTTKINSLQIST